MTTSQSTIHAAQVTTWGQPPRYVSLPSPPTPEPSSDTIQIRLLAAGVHQIVRSRAAGTHYTSKVLPHTPGVDGVGYTVPSNRLVHFSTLQSGSGSFAELINVPKRDVNYLPEKKEGESDEEREEKAIKVAAFANPALSSWMGLKKRTVGLEDKKGFRVLVLGVTSASGRIAVQVARHFGAGSVVGAARDEEALKKLVDSDSFETSERKGLDSYIVFQPNASDTDFSSLGDIDVILDYVYGPPTEELFKQLKSKVPTQYVQIGSLAGTEINLPSAALRSRDITLRGSGPGAFDLREMGKEMGEIVNAVWGMEVEKGLVREVKLGEVEGVWGEKEKGRRVVFVP